MLILYLINIVSTVEGGLFDLASRHGGSEPLWQQVKALERINSFLKDVQKEIKESRALLRHINFKNPSNNQPVTDLRHDQTPSVNSKLFTNRYFSMVVSDVLKEDPAITSSTTPSIRTKTYTSSPTSFLRQGAEVRTPVIPDIVPDYEEILPYFRHKGRHDHQHPKLNKKKDCERKHNQHASHPTPISKRKAGMLLKAPSYRPMIGVDEYVKLQNNIDKTQTHENGNHNRFNNKNIIRNKVESDTTYMSETIYYNRYKNFGQKRFNIVNQRTDNENQFYSQKRTTVRTKKFTELRLVKRPLVNFKSRDVDKPVINERAKLDLEHTSAKIVHRSNNKHLRRIIEASSYSDEETALIVNLMDQFYHYNKTNKQNTEDKVL